ncbi:MAG: vitamin B12 dependent-methionine synthase activation domain-containing protein [Sphaerochaetaceae bacterium]
MNIILKPNFDPLFSQYQKAIRFDNIDDAQEDATLLFNTAVQKLKPKVMLKELFIDGHSTKDGLPTVTIESLEFTGKALRVLNDVHRVFVYIATCGNEMEDFDIYSLDMLAPYWLDIVKSQALGVARREMLAYVRDAWQVKRPLSVNPGSGNVDIWPIEQMQDLFKLLGGGGEIGVSLNGSSLMTPNKSIAGLLFTSAESDWESCAHCERERCPSRRVPFKEKM